MKKRTIIILGNGFDLDLGLRTSFRDYLQSTIHTEFSVNTATFQKIEDKNKNNWGDIEGVLRESILDALKSNVDDIDKDINVTWNMIRKGWGIYLPKYIETVQNILKIEHDYLVKENIFDDFPIRKKSCAYLLARKIKNWNSVYTFNYTNPTDILFGERFGDINFIHGELTLRKQTQFKAHLIDKYLALGVDYKRMNEETRKRELLSPIMKLTFMETYSFRDDLNEAMMSAENIIFFGHSMSITDSDYFEDFFHGIIDGLIADKGFFFITKDSNGLSDIKEHMSEWEIDFDKLNNSTNKISVIFTDDGIDDENFKRCLDML